MKITKLLAIIVLVVASIVSIGVVLADSDSCSTNPDSELPECFTPEDNECYPDGEMADRCETDYDWNFGWYLARYNNGQIAYDDIPEAYRPILVSDGGDDVAISVGGCIQILSTSYVPGAVLSSLGSSVSVVQAYDDADCSSTSVSYALFATSSPTQAADVCDTYYGGPGAGSEVDYSSAFPNLWRCNRTV